MEIIMEIIFENVTIWISASNPKEAYNKLCNALGTLGDDVEWETDTYANISLPIESVVRYVEDDLYPDAELTIVAACETEGNG
jgi:hypothetical protein